MSIPPLPLPLSSPLPPLYRDLWWLISKAIDDPNDWLEFRSTCSLFLRSSPSTRKFGVAYMRCVKSTRVTHGGRVNAIVVFKGKIVTGSADKTIKIWSRPRKVLHTRIAHAGGVTCLAVFDGKLASGSKDSTIKWWDENGTWLNTLHGHHDAILSMCPAFNDKFLASSSRDATIRIWAADGKNIRTIGTGMAMALASYKNVLMSGYERVTSIALWTFNGNETSEVHGTPSKYAQHPSITSIAFHDGHLIGGESTGAIMMWDLKPTKGAKYPFYHMTDTTERVINKANPLYNYGMVHNYTIVSLSTYKGLLVSGSRDEHIIATDAKTGVWLPSNELNDNKHAIQVIKIWDESYKCMKAMRGHKATIRGIVQYEDSLVSVALDGNIRIWDSVYPSRYGHVIHRKPKSTPR